MSLPYIPGWWDTISQNAQRLAQQLPQSIEPQRVAERQFQQLVQQNPMLMQEFANMDPATREMMSQAMGMKTMPETLTKLPKGRKLKAEEEMDAFRSSLSPEMQQRMYLTQLGLKPESEYMLERTGKELDIAGKTTEIEGQKQRNLLGGLQIRDAERNEADILKASKKYPELAGININNLARDIVRTNQQVDPNLITAITANPGAKVLFEKAVASQQMKYEGDLRAQLAKMRTPQDKNNLAMELLRTLQAQGASLENQLDQLNVEQRLHADNPMNMRVPFPGAERVTALQAQLAENTKKIGELYNSLLAGADINTGSPAGTPAPAVRGGSVGPLDTENRLNNFRKQLGMDYFGGNAIP